MGARAKQMENPFLKGRVDGIADIGDPVSAEKVAELKPDLIIVSNDDEFEAMSKIAPTVLIPYATSKKCGGRRSPNRGLSWRKKRLERRG